MTAKKWSLTKEVKQFFVETFRFHSGKEYREIITRGMHADKSGENGQYPWMYIRVAALLFVVFAVNVLILRVTHNSLFVPSIIFLGGATVNFVFILFLYELYPGNDFSILSVLMSIILGGSLSCLITQVVYYFWSTENAWVSTIKVAVVEELAKAVTALIVIGLVKCKKPFIGFLIGASVGTGFSIIEDMGYIYYYSRSLISPTGVELMNVISLFIDRTASTFCTHILWTGFIGWVTLKLQGPQSAWKFFATLAYDILLHFLWDMPIEGWGQVVIQVICGLSAGIFAIVIVTQMRRAAIREYGEQTSVFDRIPFVRTPRVKKAEKKVYFRHAANLSFSITCVLLSLLVFAYCLLPVKTENKEIVFSDSDEFVSYMQNGLEIPVDWNRPYDEGMVNEEEFYRGGKLAYVVQRQNVDSTLGILYTYHVVDGGTAYLTDVQAIIDVDGNVSTYGHTTLFVQGKEVNFFFINNTEALSYSVSGGRIFVEVELTEEEQQHIEDSTLIILEIGAGIVAVEAVLFMSFKLKERSIRKHDEDE